MSSEQNCPPPKMKMATSRVLITVCLLALVPSCESAKQKLKSLNDLKKIDFGQSVPKHSLLLLHWFANVIDVDNNDVLILTFDPNTDFGSHHYGNFEDMLDPLPQGYRYYTVGNLYGHESNELPQYVLQPPDGEYQGNNMDRIIFRVQERNSKVQRIDQVYLTQHYRQYENQGTRYNPEHTYRISPMLLHEIRLFSVEDNPRSLQELRDMFHSDAGNSQLRDFRNIWGHSLAWLGLLLFIVKEKKSTKRPIENRHQTPARRNTQAYSVVDIPDELDNSMSYNLKGKKVSTKRPTENRHQSSSRRNTQAYCVVDIPDELDNSMSYYLSGQREQPLLDVVTGKNGKATIVWKNVSRHWLKEGVAVVLFNHETNTEASSTHKLIQHSEGRYDTSVPLNEGLQVRLHRARRQCLFWTKVEEEICKGTIFKSPDPVLIPGFEAYLQLFVKDSKACARLFVNKSFGQWKSEFQNSWIGFYDSARTDTRDYKWWKWQWVTRFEQGPDMGDYKTYEYYSSMTVTPGVQARFVLRDYTDIARTPILR